MGFWQNFAFWWRHWKAQRGRADESQGLVYSSRLGNNVHCWRGNWLDTGYTVEEVHLKCVLRGIRMKNWFSPEENITVHNIFVPSFHDCDILRVAFTWCVCLYAHGLCIQHCACVFLHADHPAKGGVAGVQLSSGCRWALHLHSGGTWTEPVLQGCQRQTAPAAPGESMHTQPHTFQFASQHT